MPLTLKQKAALKQVWDLAPNAAAKQQLMAFAQSKGISDSDFQQAVGPGMHPRDYGPGASDFVTDLPGGMEAKAAAQGLLRGLTLRMVDLPPEETTEGKAFEFDVPGLAEKFPEMFKGVSPSRAAGEAVGTAVLPLKAAGWLGKKALGLSPVAAELAQKGIKLTGIGRLAGVGATRAGRRVV